MFSGHLHGAIWVDFKEFLKDERNAGFEGLEEVFEKIHNELRLTDEETSLVTRFADKFISVSLEDPETVDIVKQVNIHHHTRSCRKFGNTSCRFHYPQFPFDETLLAIPAKVRMENVEARKQMMKEVKAILKVVKTFLENEEEMKELIAKYPNVSPRAKVLALLMKSGLEEHLIKAKKIKKGQYTEMYWYYREALKISEHGYQIVHKRSIEETWVNRYNPEFIKAWNANCDLSLTLDHYAIVTYICNYISKDESGTMEFIKRALKDKENGPMKEKLQTVRNVFQTHRQIGEAEAIYRIMKSFHLSGSNITTHFVHCGFRELKSRMLKEI